MQGGPETSNRLNRIREYKRKQLNEYYIYIYVYLSNNNNKNNASNSNSSSSRNSNSHLFGGGCLGELHEARDVGQQRVQEGDDEGLQRGSQSINDVVDVSKTYKITIKRKRQKQTNHSLHVCINSYRNSLFVIAYKLCIHIYIYVLQLNHITYS